MKPGISVRFLGLLFVVATGVLAACSGDEPTTPTPAIPTEPQVLPAGRYTVSVGTSFDTSSCAGRLDSWGLFGPSVSTYVELSGDGNAWSAHAQSATDGDVNLRLRRDGDNGGEVLVSGEIQGTLFHLLDRFTPPAKWASFAAAAKLEGRVLRLPSATGNILGTAQGRMTFTHPSGTTVVCERINVLMTEVAR